MTATEVETTYTGPGIYDLTDVEYHSDALVPGGSLSSSGARKLLPPSCPALYKYERDNGSPTKKTFDIGHAAHKLALGVGPEIVVVPGDRWDTKEAKARVKEARDAGQVPVKQAERDELEAMATALRNDRVAMDLFAAGTAESSLFWTDEPSNVTRRARLDWLPQSSDGRMIVPDYKTAVSADPEKFSRAAMDHGYHQQAAWYLDAVKALDLAESAVFVFVVQMKTPPYLVTVAQLDVTAMRIGQILNRRAINRYAECVAGDHWPGFAEDVALVSLPYFYSRNFEGSL